MPDSSFSKDFEAIVAIISDTRVQASHLRKNYWVLMIGRITGGGTSWLTRQVVRAKHAMPGGEALRPRCSSPALSVARLHIARAATELRLQ